MQAWAARWGGGRTRTVRNRAAAFTLLEVVLAVAILLMLAALTLPLLTGLSAKVRLKEASRTIESATAMARADAISSAGPVALIARERSDGQVELRGVKLDSLPARTGRSDAGESESAANEPDSESGYAGRGEVYAHLPEGVKVEWPEPADNAADSFLVSSDSSPTLNGVSSQISSAVAREVVVVVMLPNGGARAESAWVLRDRVGREAAIHVNSWTGVATVDAASEPRAARGDGAKKQDGTDPLDARSPGRAPSEPGSQDSPGEVAPPGG